MDASTAVRRTAIAYGVLAAIVAVVVTAVLAIVGLSLWLGLILGVVVGAALAALGFLRADSLALNAIAARPMAPGEMPKLENLVEGLVIANGFRMPSLYVVEDGAPNAAAVGRHPRHSALVVTTGLTESLRRIELEGVLAHELIRIRHRETLVGVAAGLLAGHLPRSLGAALGARMLEPSASVLADLGGVELTRYPPGLAGALESMASDGRVVKANPRAYRHLWVNTPDDAMIEPEFSLGARIAVLHEL